MEKESYKVIFTGEIEPGQNIDEVKQKIADVLYRGELSKVEQTFFTGKRIIMKSGLDYSKALKLTEILNKRTGSIFEVIPHIDEQIHLDERNTSNTSDKAKSSKELYSILFYGEIRPEKNIVDVKTNLAEFFDTPSVMIEVLFTNYPIVLKNDLELQSAEEYKERFESTGAICNIETSANYSQTQYQNTKISSQSIEDPTLQKKTPFGTSISAYPPKSKKGRFTKIFSIIVLFALLSIGVNYFYSNSPLLENILQLFYGTIDNSINEAISKVEGLPEFDGGYIKTINNEYIEVSNRAVITNVFGENYRVYDKKGMLYVPVDKFKGILIKGQYNFERFSLHRLITTKCAGEVCYQPGIELESRSKSEEDDSYYFEPRNQLYNGEYVAWIGKTFWLFTIVEEGQKIITHELNERLLEAIELKDVQHVQQYLQEGAYVNMKVEGERYKECPILLYSVVKMFDIYDENEKEETRAIVELLLKYGADVNASIDSQGKSVNAMIFAEIMKDKHLINLLKKFGAVSTLSTAEIAEGIEARSSSLRKRTYADMRALGTGLNSFLVDNDKYPNQLSELLSYGYYSGTLKDAWGTPFSYQSDGKEYRLISYGSDQKAGGEGFETDIIHANGAFATSIE